MGGDNRIKSVNLADLDQYIGHYIEFLFYPGWEEPWKKKGYLHGINRVDGMNYVLIDDSPTLPKGKLPSQLGGYNVRTDELIRVHPKS